MQSGELPYSKARALTRVATAENEEKLMDFARHGTASHVEKLVRGWRRADRLEEQWHERDRHRTRELTIFPDEDGMYLVRGRLDPEVGALLTRALEAAGEALYGRSMRFGGPGSCGDSGAADRQAAEMEELTTGTQRRADAIGLLAERALHSGLEESGECVGRADRFQVVLHVGHEAFTESSGLAESSGSGRSERSESAESSELALPSPKLGGAIFEDGVRVPAGTSRLFACDASRVIRDTRSGWFGARRGQKGQDHPTRHPKGARSPGRRLPLPGLWAPLL
jgi:hypothetical protein